MKGAPAIGRFAPSTTGHAHPGTLLSALLVHLDAGMHDGSWFLRFEDLDPQRCKPEFVDGLRQALEWLGLAWSHETLQSEHAPEHHAALDALAQEGRLYACECSRAEIRMRGAPAPDGGTAYDNHCRSRTLALSEWRASELPLRVNLGESEVELIDEGGEVLSQAPAEAMGDPVVRRRDGAVAYQLASVVDDAREGVTRIVRGRDIAPSTATQRVLQDLLGLPAPRYRHHPLLLEQSGNKLAKLHASLPWPELHPRVSPQSFLGALAHTISLRDTPEPVSLSELEADFAWDLVAPENRLFKLPG